MYSTSEYYKQAIKKSRPSYLTGTITFKGGSTREFDDTSIALGGASITMQAVTQDVLEFGATVLGQLDIALKTDKNESRYKYYDATIDLQFHIDTENDVETIPLGQWTVAEAERDKTALKLIAYDNLLKLDKKLETTFVDLPYTMMQQIAEDCGVELAEDENYYKSLPNGDYTLTITEGSSCSTYRQATSIIAQMCGCFVQADRDGRISLKQFSSTPTFSMGMGDRYRSSISDFVCQYVKLEVTGLGGTFISITEEDAEGMTMHLEDAPAWDDGTDETFQKKADNLMMYLEDIVYTPCELSAFSDPSIDCGDLIELDTEDGVVNTLITSYTWNYHGQLEIQSVGKNPYLISTSAETQRKIRDLEVNGTGSGTPTALYQFKNHQRFKCTDMLETLAQTTFAATDDTFVLFSGTMQLEVDVPDEQHTTTFTMLDSDGKSKVYEIPYNRNGTTQLNIQYYYNSVEFGQPYSVTLEKGTHLITLHYPISGVTSDSIGRFEVRMSKTGSGTISVAKEMFMGTISGQGLAGKPKWDGTITNREIFSELYSIADIKAVGFSAETAVIRPHNDVHAIAERFGVNDILTVTALGFDSEFSTAKVVTNYTFEVAKKSIYEYSRELVLVTDTFHLRQDYSYTSTAKPIDSGAMASVVINTTNKTSVESVVISSEL